MGAAAGGRQTDIRAARRARRRRERAAREPSVPGAAGAAARERRAILPRRGDSGRIRARRGRTDSRPGAGVLGRLRETRGAGAGTRGTGGAAAIGDVGSDDRNAAPGRGPHWERRKALVLERGGRIRVWLRDAELSAERRRMRWLGWPGSRAMRAWSWKR